MAECIIRASRDIKTKFAFRQIFVAEGAKQGGIIVDYHLAKLPRCTNYTIVDIPYIAIPAATDTLKDSFCPFIGISTNRSIISCSE